MAFDVIANMSCIDYSSCISEMSAHLLCQHLTADMGSKSLKSGYIQIFLMSPYIIIIIYIYIYIILYIYIYNYICNYIYFEMQSI